jgi:hypothetical protein
MFWIVLLFFACENSTSSGSDTDIHFVGATINYDVTASGNFQKKPLASLKNDTLEIADYWAMSQQPPVRALAEVKGDSLIVHYERQLGPANDWMPTVEALVRFTARSVPSIAILKIDAVSDTSVNYVRPPDSLEITMGFRDARHILIKQILRDSL